MKSKSKRPATRKPRHPVFDKMEWWHIVIGIIITIVSTVVLVMTAIGFTGETTGTRLVVIEKRIDALEAKTTHNTTILNGVIRIECRSNDPHDRENANMSGICWAGRDTTR